MRKNTVNWKRGFGDRFRRVAALWCVCCLLFSCLPLPSRSDVEIQEEVSPSKQMSELLQMPETELEEEIPGTPDPAGEIEESVEAEEATVLQAVNAPVQVSITYYADAGLPDTTELVVREEAETEAAPTEELASLRKSAAKSLKTMSASPALKRTAASPENHKLNQDDITETADVSLTEWQVGEEAPTIPLYHRTLDISLVAEGEEIEPNPEASILVTVVLPDLQEGLEVEVRHETAAGSVLLESTTEGQQVTFVTDSFSLFDFSAAARQITSWTTDLLENAFYGIGNSAETRHNSITAESPIEGLSILEAFSTTQGNNLWLMMQRVKDIALGKLESITLYAVEDGKLAGIIKEKIGITDVLRFNLGNYSSFALVRDSGLRNKVEELGNVILSGLMPKNGLAEATDVTEEYADFVPSKSVEQVEADETSIEQGEADEASGIEQGETVGAENGETAHTIAAYDISITNDGEEYQPEDKPIEVTIKDEAIAKAVANGNAISLWHVLDDGTTEQITDFTVSDDTLNFSASGFSVYVVTETTVEKILTAADGNVYKITVTYDGAAQIPEGAELVVTEVDEEQYLASTATALGVDESYLLYRKFLDISFIDADGAVVEPATPVQVKIELLDVDAGADKLQVVHFGETGAEKVTATANENAVVTFSAGEFSVFGFGNVLEPIDTVETDEASVEILGFETGTQLTSTDAPEVEEGLEVLGAYNLSDAGQNKLWIKAELKEGVELTDMESVAVYTVKDSNGEDEAGKTVEELTQVGNVAELTSTEFAVVKDSGYRHLSFELNVDEEDNEKTVTLDGMMPKMATAEAADVTELYSTHEFTETTPIYNEETGAESTPVDDEAGEEEQKETTDDAGEEEQEASEEEHQEPADDHTTQRSTIAAFDISISNNSVDYQPDADHPVAVVITDERILPGSNLELWHIKGDGTEEQVEDFSITTGTLSFTATGFSTYALVSTITTYYQTASGETYKITVEYGEDAGLPVEVELRITEVAVDEYLADTATALGTTDSYLLYKKFFDISFVRTDEDGEHIIEPNAPVNVTIELLDVTAGADKLQVVHFGETGAEKITATATEEAVVSFTSSEFSVFGIGNVLTPIATAETNEANIEILGFSGEAELSAADTPAVEEGLEVLGAYNLSNEAEKVWIKADVKDGVELSSKESVVIYTIKDSIAETPTEEDEASTGDEQTSEVPDEKPTEDQEAEQNEEQSSVKSAAVENGLISELVEAGTVAELTVSNFALVKDTGYRHLNFEINVGGEKAQAEGAEEGTSEALGEDSGDETANVIILDGMMPKLATAEAVDVTEAYTDHEYVVPEEEQTEEGQNTPEEPVDQEASEEQPVSNDVGEGAEGPVVEEPQEGTEELQDSAEVEQKRTTLAAFNITISNENSEYQPDANHPITVEIHDGRIVAGANIELWHIKDDGTEERISEFTVEDGRVEFISQGFSAYAIVSRSFDEADEFGWLKVTDADEFTSLAATGLYVSSLHDKNNLCFFWKDNIIPNCTSSGPNGSGRSGIEKIKPRAKNPDYAIGAGRFYFEHIEDNKYYIYFKNGDNRTYLKNTNSNQILSAGTEDRSAFIVTDEGDSKFSIKSASYAYYINMTNDDAGTGFAAWNSNNNSSKMYLWHYVSISSDPYELDGQTYGLMYWNDSVAGKAMMASSVEDDPNALESLPLPVVVKKTDRTDRLFVPNDSDISMWTFHWRTNDLYYISTEVDGETKYLKIDDNGVYVVDQGNASEIQVCPENGKIYLKCGNNTITYSGNTSDGFIINGGDANKYLYLVDYSELTSEYMITYSARKVSVTAVENGQQVIVYTRAWDDEEKKYLFYAIDHDGTLVRCYEEGDLIEWIGDRINTLLWDFTEYYWDDNADPKVPNNYYELYNEYSEKYIAPQISNGQTLADDKIGIHLKGRSKGEYYSTIIAWDDNNQKFAGLRVPDTYDTILSCVDSEAMDFYFAIVEDVLVDDELTTVETVSNSAYGITMKMKDFPSNNNSTSSKMNDYFTSTSNVKGLLETNLSDGNYPLTSKGLSLKDFFAGAETVDHLFIKSTYNASGYYEYDSTQNFASLQGRTSGDFVVYEQLGTHELANTPTMEHGQFLPYSDIQPGRFSTLHPQNLYSALSVYNNWNVGKLPESDPRKYEKLYLVDQANLHFAMEMEASFVQTPSGHDNWGHDIIYEFTGDDDFWLYVDGELIIDLGGIHSALEGKVNYCTGEVYVQGLTPSQNTTIKDLFYNNYLTRNPGDTAGAEAYIGSKFEQNSKGQWVFKDYTTHTMRIFYMERGGGASNLHMRFNLASVKDGFVELSKELEGIENSDMEQMEFPYQIYYKLPVNEGESVTENLLIPDKEKDENDESDDLGITVQYKGTDNDVPFRKTFSVGGVTYENVFLLKPGQTAEIDLPDETISYKIIECGVNSKVFSVDVNVENANELLSEIATSVDGRNDYSTDYKTAKERSRVNYVNTVKPEALRTLYIRKVLYNESGEVPVIDPYNGDATTFGFRLSFESEISTDGMTYARMFPYFVKDPEGYYCQWNASQQIYVRILDSNEHGITDYDDLSDEQKESARVQTSYYGSIARIPAFYTVEIRDVLIGMRYKVEERESEIPKGYSLWKYVSYSDNPYINNGEALSGIDELINLGTASSDPIQGTVVEGEDPLVDVYNLKGYGINVTKVWSDADYVETRDPTYFAIYLNNGTALKLIDDLNKEDSNLPIYETVYQLPYETSEIYWYLERLVTGTTLGQYEVREVTVTDPVIAADGKVTSYTSIMPVDDGQKISLNATLRGSNSQPSEYTVSYSQGTLNAGSNVRYDIVTNSRAGIIIKKTDMDGEPLGNAEFTLKGSDGSLIGTYTSGTDGIVTTAYLVDDEDYTLEETKSPYNTNLYRGYFGLQSPIIIRKDSIRDEVVISSNESGYVDVSGDVITIKNRVYHFQTVKVDKASFDQGVQEPVQGAVFALHKKKKVGTWTGYDFSPEEGYENLVSGSNGLIEKIDSTLAPGSYELREKQEPSNYKKLSSYIHFTISPLNVVTLDDRNRQDGVHVEETIQDDGSVMFTLIIPNEADSQLAELTIEKNVTGDMGDLTKQFVFTLTSVGEDVGADETVTYEWMKTSADNQTTTTGTIPAGETFTLAHGESIKIYVPFEEKVIITESNENYTTQWQRDLQPVQSGNTITATISESLKKTKVIVTNDLPAVAPTGINTRHTPWLLLLAFGLMLLIGGGVVMKTRRGYDLDDGAVAINPTQLGNGPLGGANPPVVRGRESVNTGQPTHSTQNVEEHIRWRNSVWVENNGPQRGFALPRATVSCPQEKGSISCPQAKLWMTRTGPTGKRGDAG